MSKIVNKYRIYQTKTCGGRKDDWFNSSTNDINIAFQRVAKIRQRIVDTGRHSTTYYVCGSGYGGKCKAQFEVREFDAKTNKKDD